MRALLLLVAACAPPAETVLSETGESLSVDASIVPIGTLVALRLQVSGPEDADWSLQLPTPEGLKLGAPTERTERVGGRRVETSTFPIDSTGGSFVLEPLCAVVAGQPQACVDPIFLDLGEPPDRSGLADIIDPSRMFQLPPTSWIVGGLAITGVLGLGLWVVLRPREQIETSAVAAEAPDLAALRRWDAIRGDDSLSDHEKALGLSYVFRVYATAVLSFPAHAWTTTETLSHLRGMEFLPPENVPRAKRLLRATDRVKYAEATPGRDFFEDLDGDLRAFVESTRPRTWGDA